jgi:hypothetical protein
MRKRRAKREGSSAPSATPAPPTLKRWAKRVEAIQDEVSALFHGDLPAQLETLPTVRSSLRVINIILNGLRHPEAHEPPLIEKLHNVARGGNVHSAASADLLDAVLHVRTIKLVWPDKLADGVRERLSEYGSAFAEETTERIEHLLRGADPENLRAFAAPVADLAIAAWVRAGSPVREAPSPAFHFPIEPKSTLPRARRALLTRILNAVARHERKHTKRSRAE